ncbi:hypothetical protein ACO0LD_31475 [Undibacterium sp. Ji83W]|uniref:hypothetical protein n=1 Tax=Undibacterium sp. Ji83W TaxID=3413043 RepID=UPI003BF14FD1
MQEQNREKPQASSLSATKHRKRPPGAKFLHDLAKRTAGLSGDIHNKCLTLIFVFYLEVKPTYCHLK